MKSLQELGEGVMNKEAIRQQLDLHRSGAPSGCPEDCMCWVLEALLAAFEVGALIIATEPVSAKDLEAREG